MGSEDREIGDRLSVPELVAVYQRAEQDMRAGFALVAGALARLDQSVAGDHSFILRRSYGNACGVDWNDPSDQIEELRRDVWEKLLERMQIRKAMSIAAWKKLEDEVRQETPPEITIENVESLIAQFREDMPTMLEAAVVEVFDLLRPPGSRYKTNTEFELGDRVCLTYYVEPWVKGWHVIYDREQSLIALENVFRMLDHAIDQAPEQRHYSDLSTEIKRCPSSKCFGATPYFEFRGYRNHSLHLKFKRPDLVARLNAIAGGARLKPVETE